MTIIISKLTPGCEEGKTFSSLEYLLPLFPPNQLRCMTLYTYQQMFKHVEKGKPVGKMIKWFGIIILAARFEFGDRDSLWSTVSQSKYSSAPDFGKTILNRRRFAMLWRHVQWSHQSFLLDEGTSHDAYL